jgi:hypothetical protein
MTNTKPPAPPGAGLNEAREAIGHYLRSPDHRRQKAALQAIESCSLAENSDHRLLTVISLIEFFVGRSIIAVIR